MAPVRKIMKKKSSITGLKKHSLKLRRIDILKYFIYIPKTVFYKTWIYQDL